MSPRSQTGGIIGDEDQEKTWAESIRAYHHGKTHLAWDSSEVAPPTFSKHYDVTRKDRDMDPILMRHRDPAVEARRKEHEESHLRAAMNTAKSRQIRKQQSYDIVNHTSLATANKDPTITKVVRYPDSRTSYNIVNHMPRDNAYPLTNGDSPKFTPRKAVPVIEGGKKQGIHNMKRDVDILSNRYLEKHDERAAEEQKFLQEKAEKEFRRTRKYNPITGTYYDESNEHDFVQSRAKLESLQGRAQQLRLPPSIRYGEGNDYNIINKQPKGFVNKLEIPERGQGKRILNQSSHGQHAEALHTGHMVTNNIFAGREEHPEPKPRARAPVPVWDRLSGPERHARAENAPTDRQEYTGRSNAHGREIEVSGAVVGEDHRQLNDGHLVEEAAITRTSTPQATVPALNLSIKP